MALNGLEQLIQNNGDLEDIYTAVNSLTDLSLDTVTAAALLSGIKAHDRLGNALTGTHVCQSLPPNASGVMF